jgi:hypothetical protein
VTPHRIVALLCVALVGLLTLLYLGFDVHFALNNDALYFSHNKAQALQAAFMAGDLPMWNRLEGAGIDQLAEGSKDFLASPLLLVVDAKSYLVIAGFVLLAGSIFAFYWFAVSLGLRPWPAAVAACVWAANGSNLWHLHELNQQSVVLWMPVVLGAIALLDRQPKRARVLLVVAACVSLSYGRLELTEFIYATAVVFVCVHTPASRRLAVIRTAAVTGAIGAVLAAWFLAPYVHALATSARIDRVGAPVYWPWDALLRHLLPSTEVRLASRAYLPLVAVPLVLLGLRRHRRMAIVAAVLAAAYLLLAFDTGVYPWVQALPLHGANWNVERFVVLGFFSISLLTACGLDTLEPDERARLSPRLAMQIGVLTGAMCVLLVATLLRMPEVPQSVLILNSMQLAATVVIVTGLLYASCKRRPVLHRVMLGLAAVAALAFGFGFNRLDRNDGDLAELDAVYFGRIAGSVPSAASVRSRKPGSFRVVDELQFHPAFWASVRLESLGYYTPFAERHLAAYVARLNGGRALDVAGVRRGESILARLADARIVCTRRTEMGPGWERIYDHGGVFCYERPDYLPRYRLVHEARTLAAGEDPVAAIVALALEDPAWFDRGVIVEAPVTTPRLDRGSAVDRVIDDRTSTNRIDLTVEVSGPGAILTVANRFDEGWHATIDGRPARLFRANGLFQGIAVETGRHAIVLRYRTPYLVAGALTSLAGLLFCALWLRFGRAARPHGG